jgi:hypothetical protein
MFTVPTIVHMACIPLRVIVAAESWRNPTRENVADYLPNPVNIRDFDLYTSQPVFAPLFMLYNVGGGRQSSI